MKIGIMVHSQTGNTYSVAQRIEKRLSELGHSVNIERVVPLDESKTDVNDVKLESAPDILGYDAIIFAAPVRGFSLSPAMSAYLAHIGPLNGMKVACFVTHFLPFSWMGGTGSIGQMTRACSSKGAVVCATGIIDWSSGQRDRKIEDLLGRLIDCIQRDVDQIQQQ